MSGSTPQKRNLWRNEYKGKIINTISQKEQEWLIEGGKKIQKIYDKIKEIVKPGISTIEADIEVQKLIKKEKLISAPIASYNLPSWVCWTINENICHQFGSEDVIIKRGDKINVDISFYSEEEEKKSLCWDSATNFLVGEKKVWNVKDYKNWAECEFEIIKDEPDILADNFFRERLKTAFIIKEINDLILNSIEKILQKEKKIFFAQIPVIIEKSFRFFNKILDNKFCLTTILSGHSLGLHLHIAPFIPNSPNPENEENGLIQDGIPFCVEPCIVEDKIFKGKRISDHQQLIKIDILIIKSDKWTYTSKIASHVSHLEIIIIIKDGKLIKIIP